MVEIPDDSTSSSTPNSTRRASSTANTDKQPPENALDQNQPRLSPDTDADSDVAFSPVQYPDLQALANRSASSGDSGQAGDSHGLSSSPFSGSSADGSEDVGIEGVSRVDDDDEDSATDEDFDAESTAMSMDDMTVQSSASARTDASDSTSSSARLNDALRQAANEAGTRGIDYDENAEMSTEMASQEIAGAFQPWIKKGQRQSFDWDDISAGHGQENVDPSKRLSQGSAVQASDDIDGDDEDMSMEVTNALGGILSKQPNRRQSTATARRQSSGAETSYDDQTMEFTGVVGGIAQPPSPTKSSGAESFANDDEEMTMEFTSVVGGVLNKNTAAPRDTGNSQPESHTRRASHLNFSEWSNDDDDDDGMDMEMTGAIGGILPPIEERTEPQDDNDQTAAMDFTAVGGRILPPGLGSYAGNNEKEFDLPEPGSSPFQEQVRQSPAKSPPKSPTKSPSKSPAKSPGSFHVATIASENGSPSLASVRARRVRSSSGRAPSKTPTPNSRRPSATEEETTPSKLPTPRTQHTSNSQKTPPSGAKSFHGTTPPEHFGPELQVPASQNRSPRKGVFEHNVATGESTPQFILRPQNRRSSGVGIDKEGLGSPRVAAMLDKRRSIGEETPQFVPQEQPKQGVRFEDPLRLQEEVDQEREEEENREDGHIPPLHPSQPNEKGTASNLRDMISSLTPKKNITRGRKSLHVGSAMGLLGKRPRELDQSDEEDEDEESPKRLKGRQVSPVKGIKLAPPPSKDETVGRLRSPLPMSFESPSKSSATPTQGLKSAAIVSPVKDASGSFGSAAEPETVDEEITKDESQEMSGPIQLQDFLNMTNIHFMELTTTKRRHTTAPGSATKKAKRRSSEIGPKVASFEDGVAAGFCTVPMLELYQHSCRELKSYISEGRQVIRSIEAETFAENPPLFREYMLAAPDIRLLMDNQFRNVKTHARLLSKATWYEWRMKLLDGLKEGLNRHVDEMKADDKVLSKHEAILNSVVPALTEKHSSLEQEATSLQQLAEEMENCDQDELRAAREKLSSVEDDIAAKKQELEELQTEVQDKTNIVEAGTEMKAEFVAQIQEAERVKAECRGWSAKDINELKTSVQNIEEQTGWSIAYAEPSSESAAGPSLTMFYRNQLQLVFYPGAFYTGTAGKTLETPEIPVELRYQPRDTKKSTIPTPQLSSIASLVLKSLQTHLSTINQPTTSPRDMLRFVSEAWDLVLNLEEEIRMLEFCGVTKLTLLESEDKPSLRARCTLLGAPPSLKNSRKGSSARRIDIDFAVKTRVLQQKKNEIGVMDVETDVIATKVYGFGSSNQSGLSEDQMRDIIYQELGAGNKNKGTKDAGVQLGNGVWCRAVRSLTGTVF